MIAVFVLTAALALTSCGSVPGEKAARSLQFPAELSVECAGAGFVMTADGSGYTAEYYSPAELDGITVARGEEGATVNADGFAIDCGPGFPAVEGLYRALKAINGGAAYRDTQGTREYTIDETAITVYYEPESGIVTNIITEEALRRFEYRVLTARHNERTGNGEDKR